MMKIARLICAVGICAPLVLQAGAAEAPVPGRSSVDTSVRAEGQRRTQAARPGDSSSGVSPTRGNAAVRPPPHASATEQRAVAPLARSSADRLHSHLGQLARAPVATASSRGAGSNPARRSNLAGGSNLAAASASGARLQGRLDANSAVPTRLPVPNDAVRRPPNLKLEARGPALGGPHLAGAGRIGGPAAGRAANNGLLDGTKLHRN
jgi:hypothetical protein